MRTRLIGSALAAGIVLFPVLGEALDSPHDRAGATSSACSFCHTMYEPSPISGTQDFSNACLTCHNQNDKTARVKWQADDEAVPGSKGTSHAWSKAATNPQYGAATFLGTATRKLLVDGKLQCVICHDPHTTAIPSSTLHSSFKSGEAQPVAGNLDGNTPGSGTLTLTVGSGIGPRGFRVKIKTPGRFLLSHDYGWKADSWLTCETGAWAPATASSLGCSYTPGGAAVALDVAGASVAISAGAVAGDHWDFFTALPFLRYSNDTDGWCYLCHKERVMNHVRARGMDYNYLPNGYRKFSHPVGVGLNANGFNTDRGTVLDADGTSGSSGTDADGGTTANDSNNLVLKGGAVGCTTCHAVHNADSNSLTVDAH